MKKILWLLIPAIALLLAFNKTNSVTVSGKVTDPKGNPIALATVKWKGTNTVATTRADGSYELSLSKLSGSLEFSSVGYETLEVKLKDQTVVNVTMQPATASLQEVVVTGYGYSRKQKNANNKAETTLSGRMPGIQASTLGSPGNGYHSDQRIRKPAYDTYYEPNSEEYAGIVENAFQRPLDQPLSTFSIDVDAASYSNVRRMLNMGQLPPADAVRIEEMVNYFNYDYAEPTDEHPFAIHTEMSDAPWNKKHKLVMIGLQGKRIPTENLPASNLVFLIDVSGSMSSANKLPLVQSSMKMLTDQLRPQDRVSIVVYAGAAGVVLEPTAGDKKTKIKEAIDQLQAGGSTAGGAGIKLAYKLARENFAKEGNNRVILCTDGDFNVGESSDDAMEKLIEKERESGIFLTVLGYGMGNYKDSKMQKLADKGNGNHAYIDGMSEARKVLVNEFGGTLFTIAKDVKLQIEFNPARVQAYRLIGYENRLLAAEDFNDDKKDAGELGSGHTVTALYEIVPVGVESSALGSVDPLKYQQNKAPAPVFDSNDWMTVKFRYKQPDGNKSRLLERILTQEPIMLSKTSDNFRFAAAVAEMGLLLRDSKHKADASFDQVIQLAKAARGRDEQGYRAEFVRLVESAGSLAKN
ncbi:MAG: von Willebrand factor type A domain-containing protein [Chitinophagaceae bacterium]